MTDLLPWVPLAAGRFRAWLIANDPAWTEEAFENPGIFRWTVGWIGYERLWEPSWDQAWFIEGMQAFAMISLLNEGSIVVRDGTVVTLPDGREFAVEAFLAGKSLAIRHDPAFADLAWDPVSAAVHLLSEYEVPAG